MRLPLVFWLACSSLILAAAPATPSADFDAAAILAHRAQRDAFYRDNPQSPFQRGAKGPFTPLRYFAPDASWVFRAKLHLHDNPEPVRILDTKGRTREGVVLGHFNLERDGRTHVLRVYRLNLPGGGFHHAVWFTDRTTGDTTYEVGRYLDFERVEDPNHVYTLDFNLAYNPYCAYSTAYGCAIPRREDRLDLAITAGEKTWHD